MMKTCPYCAEQVQANVDVCPYCDRDIASPDSLTSGGDASSSRAEITDSAGGGGKTGSRRMTWVTIVLIALSVTFALLAGLGWGAWARSNSQVTALRVDVQAGQAEVNQARLTNAALITVNARLKTQVADASSQVVDLTVQVVSVRGICVRALNTAEEVFAKTREAVAAYNAASPFASLYFDQVVSLENSYYNEASSCRAS
jgi:cell division protein FtsB